MNAYVIHHDQCLDRKDIVQDLQQKTGAKIVQACWEENRESGCIFSHVKVASQAMLDAPHKPYLVFEDDCELLDDIDVVMNQFSDADIVFLGYNDSGFDTNEKRMYLFGTHALKISPRARDIIQKHAFEYTLPYDKILSRLIPKYKLSVAYSEWPDREKYARQRKGLISTITGSARV